MADAVSSASAGLAAIEQRIAALREELKLGPAGGGGAAADSVQSFRKDTRDVAFDNAATARDIGILVPGNSRLNVISALEARDAVDVFRFRVAGSGPLSLGRLGEEGVRVQILTRTGVLVADNAPGADRTARARYAAFTGQRDDDTLPQLSDELAAGDYVLRISRQDASVAAAGQRLTYAVQFAMGGYSRDFDTVERARQPGTPSDFALPAGLTNFVQMMQDGLLGLQAAASGSFGGLLGLLFGRLGGR